MITEARKEYKNTKRSGIYVRQFSKAVKAMRNAGYTDVCGKLYPKMRHEILNEKGKEQVYHDIVAYIRKKGITK